MLQEDIHLYKDLISYCNDHASEIETKFSRKLSRVKYFKYHCGKYKQNC